MSQLVRADLQGQQQGGAVTRFFNRPVILVLLLLACAGILTWTFWPLNQDQLFDRGAKLMESDSPYDMQRAWDDYFIPLESRFPDHPYREKIDRFRAQLEAAKTVRPSEAQRFYQQGELLQKQGNDRAAKEMWINLIAAFGQVEAEKAWVQRARVAISDMDKSGQEKDRFKSAFMALEQASALRASGQIQEAERIWTALEELYRNDPAATDIIAEVKKARGK
jgi:tetratricopeptide (TPR) repeat protein